MCVIRSDGEFVQERGVRRRRRRPSQGLGRRRAEAHEKVCHGWRRRRLPGSGAAEVGREEPPRPASEHLVLRREAARILCRARACSATLPLRLGLSGHPWLVLHTRLKEDVVYVIVFLASWLKAADCCLFESRERVDLFCSSASWSLCV